MSKKIISVLLTLLLVMQGLTVFAVSDGIESAYDSLDASKKVAVDEISASILNSKFDADEIVTVIVELEDKPLVELDLGGLSVASFIETGFGSNLLSSMKLAHETMKNRVSSLFDVSFDSQYDYYIIDNSFSLTTKYSNLSQIKAMDGVKTAYVAGTYDVPATTAVSADTSMKYSSVMIGSDLANDTGYTGAGVTVGIVDTGLDVSHEAFANAPKDATLTKATYSMSVRRQLNAKGLASKLYVSQKIGFVYDYADKDNDVYPTGSDHGNHVAGTVAGYALNEDGSVKFSGVAPDAQLAIFKVFPDKDSGASTTVILAALEDAVVLGIDVLNMSLGSAAGFSEAADTAVAEVYANVEAAGINLCVAAGNDYYAGYNTDYIGTSGLYWNNIPDIGLVGSPSTYPAALSVASIENTNYQMSVFDSNGKNIAYSDTAEGTTFAFTTLAANNGGVYEVVLVGGTGTADDFAGVDVTGKIALVIRGSISFQEKMQNAADAKAVAVIVYNNQPGTINMAIDPFAIPAVSITAADGATLIANIAAGNNTITVINEKVVVASETAYQMSDFSSWGASPTLDLRPEVTAPGGNIYSSIPGNKYAVYSGTSMATPHMAGACAVLLQYIRGEFKGLEKTEAASLVNTLLMNTADPVLNEDGDYYSPRKQGAGLIKLMDCINTNAIVTVDGSARPKANLGSSEDGSYSFTMTVENLSDETVAYTPTANVQSNIKAANDYFSYVESVTDLSDYFEVAFSVDSVELEAGESADITVTLTKTGDIQSDIYVEGFVQLTSDTEEDLVVPFMGFYGDYYNQSIIDDTIYEGGGYIYSDGAVINIFKKDDSYSFYRLGYNFYTGETDINKLVYSPNMAKNTGNTNTSYLSSDFGLLANATNIHYTITNKATGSTVASYDYYYGGSETKSYYYANGGYITSLTDYEPIAGLEESGHFDSSTLAEGTYIYTISAQNAAGTKTESRSFDFIVDNTAPKVNNWEYDKDAGTLTITVSDNSYIMGTDFYLYNEESGEYAFDSEKLITLNGMTDNEDGTCTLVYDTSAVGDSKIAFVVYDYALYGTAKTEVTSGGEPTVEVDKTALEQAIVKAEALTKRCYTTASWNNLTKAVNNGKTVDASADATQSEVDASTEAIYTAINNLKRSLYGKIHSNID